MTDQHPDPLLELFGFHREIRRAIRKLEKLVQTETFDHADAVEKTFLLDFFEGPLAWHDLDEEATLLRRLRRRLIAPEDLEVLDGVTDQHEALEEAIDNLLPLLDVATTGKEIASAAQKVSDTLLPHLRFEERSLFPMARRSLTSKDLEEMGLEMHSRAGRRTANAPAAYSLDEATA